MPFFVFLWNEEIEAHVAEHGVSPEDFEEVVSHAVRRGISRSTGLPVAWDTSRTGGT